MCPSCRNRGSKIGTTIRAIWAKRLDFESGTIQEFSRISPNKRFDYPSVNWLIDRMLTKVKSKRVKAPAGPPPRLQRVSPHDRKRELVEIAYRLIAEKGLEGFRIRQVAAEADIDNGTLHYHFPSKEALIHGVVDYLVEDLQRNRAGQEQANQNALEELRREFEDIRLRVRDTPEQLTVLSELAIRSWRDPEIARIFEKVDDGWRAHLVALLDRGVQQGIFRRDLDQQLCARAIMVALRGVSYQSRLPGRQLDLLLSQLAAQTELWLTGNRPS